MKRLLHRTADQKCHTYGCKDKSKPHRKLYWYEAEAIHSGEFCLKCFRANIGNPSLWMHQYAETFVSGRKYRTLKECHAALITSILT